MICLFCGFEDVFGTLCNSRLSRSSWVPFFSLASMWMFLDTFLNLRLCKYFWTPCLICGYVDNFGTLYNSQLCRCFWTRYRIRGYINILGTLYNLRLWRCFCAFFLFGGCVDVFGIWSNLRRFSFFLGTLFFTGASKEVFRHLV